jgi:hypothetical protein
MVKRSYTPDPKPAKRVKNPKLMKSLHVRGVICVLCGKPGSLHHVYPRGQGGDDVPENLVGLCQGPGTTGCHDKIHSHNRVAMMALRRELNEGQLGYIIQYKGRAWLDRFYPEA